jgi:hypothetical protein
MTRLAALVLPIVTLCAAAAAATAPPDPYAIIEKQIAAIGGWDRIDAQRSSHSRGTIVIEGAGLEGTLETWNLMPDKSRLDFDIKVIRQVRGDNGRFAWRLDQNGKVQVERDSTSLKERQLGFLMARRDNLKRGSKVFTVTYDRADTADGHACHVLETTNTINSSVYYDFYDTTTFLPIRTIVVKPEGEEHSTYRDYRDVDGVLTPFEIRQLALPTGQRTTVRITSVEVNTPLDPALFEPPAQTARDFRFPPGATMVEVPFRLIEQHIFLPLTIQGRTRLWVLDSGAEMTCIEKDFAQELGIETKGDLTGQGATATVQVSFVTMPPFELNGLAFDSQKVAALGINDLFRKMMGMEIGGILGYDFLSRLVTKIDYAHERLTFFDPETFVYQADGVVLDAPLAKNNMFQLQITVDGQYGGVWDLDLGASGMEFLYPYAEAHGLLQRPGVTRMSFGAGGGQASTSARFHTVELAGFVVPDLTIGIPSARSKGAFSAAEKTGNAGTDLFRHFTLYLDYERGRVIVEKGADFAKAFPVDESGVQLILGDDGRMMVLLAAPGTPAETAGIHDGDVVTAIDGKSLESLGGLLEVREMLKGPAGTTIRFDLMREGKPLSTSLTLRDLYE